MSKAASNLVVLTAPLLRAGMKGGRGLKRAQADALGIPWPLRSGWMRAAVGTSVTEEQYVAFTGKRDAEDNLRDGLKCYVKEHGAITAENHASAAHWLTSYLKTTGTV